MEHINKPIYLDYAATTPIDVRVLNKMLPYMQQEGHFGNPASSTHIFGWEAKDAVDKARKMIAQLLHVSHKEIIFTSGATEANNLAIIGAAINNKHHGKHIITSLIEHKSVLDCCKYLETCGFQITYITPDAKGIISPKDIEAAIRPDTMLVSCMHINNETGVVQDIDSIGKVLKSRVGHNILFHVDAVQSAGKLVIDLSELPVDLLSISAHKMYGPKGIGALFKRASVNLQPQIYGGGHEQGLRSGTLPTHQIIGLAYALQYSIEQLDLENARLKQLEEVFLAGLHKLGGVSLNGDRALRKAGHINICIDGLHGEALVASIDQIAVSSGSACNSANSAISHVLKAMGVSERLAQSALRISVGRFTTMENIEFALAHITQVVKRLRSISLV